MNRCYVIDPAVIPSRPPWPSNTDVGLRIMDCDTIGWADGAIVRMAVHGVVAVPLIREPRPTDRLERWRVWQDDQIGGWVAHVIRPQDDDRLAREGREHQLEIAIACILLFTAAVLAAMILVVLPQCQGGQIG